MLCRVRFINLLVDVLVVIVVRRRIARNGSVVGETTQEAALAASGQQSLHKWGSVATALIPHTTREGDFLEAKTSTTLLVTWMLTVNKTEGRTRANGDVNTRGSEPSAPKDFAKQNAPLPD
jgi:hypothetical protein